MYLRCICAPCPLGRLHVGGLRDVSSHMCSGECNKKIKKKREGAYLHRVWVRHLHRVLWWGEGGRQML